MNKKRILTLLTILFLFTIIPSISNNININNIDGTLETSTDNYFFNGKEYDIELNDVYDDEDLSKVYTGANFQSVFLENDTIILNETVSPVNNTNYKSPDLGDYPATYTFDDQPVETKDTDIDYIDSMSAGEAGDIEIISEYMGHDTVVNLTSVNARNVYHYFDENQDSGTIEFYDKEFVSRNYWMLSYDGGTQYAVLVLPYILSARFYYWNGASNVYVSHTYTTDFPHFKVEFDCNTDNYSAWCEGVLVIDNLPFYNGIDADYIYRIVHYNSAPFGFYLDAVGVSWDPAYTPSEHHAGTYSFTNDAIGDNPSGWTVSETGGTVNITEELDDHKKVLEFYDDDFVNSVSAYNDFTLQSSGTIEFWFRCTNIDSWGSRHLAMYLYENGNNERIRIIFNYDDGDDISSYNGTVYENVYSGLVIDTWYRCGLDFDSVTDTFDFYLGGVKVATGLDFRSEATVGVDRIKFVSRGNNDIATTHYLDAIGYSPDPYYTIGDNLLPSLGNTMPVGLNMINGTYDYTDNMEINDGSYTNFTSTPFSGVSQYIDSVTYSAGEYYQGALINTQTDDSSFYSFGSGGTTLMNIFIDPVYAGRDFYLDINSYANDGMGAETHYFRVNGGNVLSGSTIHQHGFLIENVNTLQIYVGDGTGWTLCTLYYFMLVDVASIVNAELNYTLDLDFSEVDTSKLLALDVSSYHYTNISTDIIGKIYNYDSSSYTQMFNSSNMVETENYFMNDTIPTDYLNPSGNLRLYFTGSNSAGTFKQIIDYIKVRFYYKMDLTHTISFETNGLWKYRWELIGSLHYTSWTYFEVVDPEPNFHAISESDYATRWILQNATAVPLEDFSDNITSNAWSLEDVSIETFIESTEGDYLTENVSYYSPLWTYTGTSHNTQSEDMYAMDLEHYNNTWYVLGYINNRIYEYYENWTYKGISHDISSEDIYPQGIHFYDGYWYLLGYYSDTVYKYYTNWTYTGTSGDVGQGDIYAWSPHWVFRQGDYWYVGHVWSATETIFKFDNAWTYVSQYDVSEFDDMSDALYIDGYWYIRSGTTIHKYNSTFEPTGISYSVSESAMMGGITISNGFGYTTDTWSEAPNTIYAYDNMAEFPKIYHNNESGHVYMQTNTTELISIESIDYISHYNLSSGDYFEIDFQTSSDSEISLILLKDDVIDKTLVLSGSGNTNFERHTVQITVNEYVEFDQLKISSTFEDEDYVKVHDIITKKYTIVQGDSTDFWVGSKNQRSIYMIPSDYNLRIFEEGTKKIDTNVTITSDDYWYIYQPIPTLLCRLTLHSIEGINLDLTDFHISVNRSSGGSYSEFSLLDNTFNVDEGTMVYFEVSDRFDNLINEFQQIASDYIDLELEVYQLQIKNLMEQQTTVDINSTQTFPVLSGELIEYILSKNYYEIGYYDMDNDYHQFITYLDSNQAFELNRSKICFLSYADQQANHLSFDNYKTYINGSMIYEQIFYEDAGDNVNITITDRYDYEVYQDVYTVLSGDNFIPITLTMYSLKIMNQQEVFNHVNITRDPNDSGYFWSEWIAPGERIEFKLFAGDYIINLTDTENGWSSYGYELNGDDTLLFTSDNIISNVLINIANTNTTIGNLITYVQIDLTNQNTEINNSIISIVINIESINSTLGDLLIDIQTSITNIESSIISEIVDMGVQITNVNSSLSEQILTITTDISNLDSSITSQFLTLGVSIENINGSIIDQILLIGVNITNVQTYLNDQILNIGVNISNLDTSITNQITSVISSIENVNTTILAQISSLSSDIININSSIIGQMVELGVNITNVQTVITDQLLLLEVDITNINTSIIDQILLVIADIENIETVIDDQTLVILSDITNVNSTLLNQMVVLGVNITNINATITDQILMLNVDLTNINASISNLLYYMDVDITSIGNNITSFYAFTNTSFINLNNVMNTSFIYMENNIISINQTISNLVIGISNDIYLINGTISTMITTLENNLFLMNVSIDTALFNLDTTIDIIGANITSNYILLNNTLNIVDTNIDDSRIAMINNLLLVNNTISTLISGVYSSVYLINNSIYTAVIDLGTYLSLMNNTINGDLSFILSQNEFLTEIYQMTMFSELLNWTDIGLNTSLLTSQIDVWTFINDYVNQSIDIQLKYDDIIDNLTISAQNTIDQYLPATDVEYRLWSEELQEYITEWEVLPDNKTVSFGFFEETVPIIPDFDVDDTWLQMIIIILIFTCAIAVIIGIAVRLNKRNKSNRRKLYKQVSKGRDTEAEYYGGKENPF